MVGCITQFVLFQIYSWWLVV